MSPHDSSHREQFGRYELATVLSHYELGRITSIRRFPRGSRRSPKVHITAGDGEFLLKRRAPGRDDPYRVAFAHAIQLHLGERGFPIADLIGTRVENNSLLQLEGRTYEMFRFCPGRHASRTASHARRAGELMGRMHRLLVDCRPTFDSPVGSYHDVPGAGATIRSLPDRILAREPDLDRAELRRTSAFLVEVYEEATEQVRVAGFRSFGREIIHGDYHPGNLLFRGEEIAALLDFDSARIEPRLVDVANGALQFAMEMTDPTDPRDWPDGLDGERIHAFVGGYDAGAGAALDDRELDALPWLMLEGLIMESVIPIANEGRFARIPGSAFLDMIARKAEWLAN
ncbi:MAG: phosphotransferase, partial [Phycisphaerales bacterium]|nr:phosphotransferase [Phycisphaerales bacterium]